MPKRKAKKPKPRGVWQINPKTRVNGHARHKSKAADQGKSVLFPQFLKHIRSHENGTKRFSRLSNSVREFP